MTIRSRQGVGFSYVLDCRFLPVPFFQAWLSLHAFFMKKDKKELNAYWVAIGLVVAGTYFISQYAIDFLLVSIVALAIICVLIVYKDFITKNLEIKSFLVGAFVFIILFTGMILLIKEDVVHTSMCETFLKGDIYSEDIEVEYETERSAGTRIESKLFFKPASKEDEELVKYISDIEIFCILISVTLSIFTWMQIDYKPKSTKYGNRHY